VCQEHRDVASAEVADRKRHGLLGAAPDRASPRKDTRALLEARRSWARQLRQGYMEEYMRRALLLSCDPMVFIERPISAALLGFRAFAIIPASPRAMYKKRDGALRE